MIRFGIVGTGRISDWVLKGAVLDSRFKAVAVCSRSADSATAFINNHPEVFPEGAEVFTSIEDLANCENIDAVYIGTPNRTHCDYALTCLNAGKHVLCEKPLACSADEVRKMMEASGRNGKALMEAMISTVNPNFLAVKSNLGLVGEIRHITTHYCQYSTKYDDLKLGKVSNSFNPQMGGGALADVGIYTVYPIVALLGKPSNVIVRKTKVDTEFGPTDVQGNIILEYPTCSATLTYSKAADSSCPTEICGDKGNFILDEIHVCHKVEYLPHQAPSSGRGEPAKPEIFSEALDKDAYYYEFKEFIDVIEAGLIESKINTQQTSLEARLIMDID